MRRVNLFVLVFISLLTFVDSASQMAQAQDQLPSAPTESNSLDSSDEQQLVVEQNAKLKSALENTPCGCNVGQACGPSICQLYGRCQKRTVFAGNIDACYGNWDNGVWVITSGCGEGCRCDVPAVTRGSTIAQGTLGAFSCVTETNATTERFFIDLHGKDTGIHKLCFDKSNVEMFKEFKIKVRHQNADVWEIEAYWTSGSHTPVPSTVSGSTAGGIDPTDPAAAVITCDTELFGDVAQTITFVNGEYFECMFGSWKIKVTLL